MRVMDQRGKELVRRKGSHGMMMHKISGTHRDEDGLHGAGAEARKEALGLAQSVLVPALGVGQQAREELERAEADGGLLCGSFEHG